MDQKDSQKKYEAQLKEWGAELDKLKEQAQKKSAESKISSQKKIDELEARMQRLNDNLKALKEAGNETWGNVKEELDKGADAFKKQLKELL